MQDPSAQATHRAICDMVGGSGGSGAPPDAARALLATEALLAGEGRVSQEWAEVWQATWRRQLAAGEWA